MKFSIVKKIGLGTLALTSSLILSCNSLGMADGIDDYGENTIMPLSSISEREPNNTFANAIDISSLTYRDAVTGFISSSSDVDFYKLRTTSTQSGKMKLVLANPSANYDYSVMIYESSNSNNKLCGQIEAAGDKTILIAVKPNTTYYIKIYSANSKYTANMPYTFTLQHYSSNENVYGNLGWAYPLPSSNKTISTRHGDPGYTPDGKPHNGIDLPAKNNPSIYNTADGVVIQANYWNSLGNNVIVQTNYYEPNEYSLSGSLTVRYLHMVNKPNVSNDQTVSRGTILGNVGNTGDSHGDHLHIDINNIEETGGPTMRCYPNNIIDPTLFYPRISFLSMASENETTEEFLFENIYYSVDTVISDQVDQDEYKHFIEMYDGTADFNIVNFVKYFNYPKELFADIVKQYDLKWWDVDVIYSDDEALIAEFFGLDN